MLYFNFFDNISFMTKIEFTKKLKNVGLDKNKFAKLSGENYCTVLGWGRIYKNNKKEKKVLKVPIWIDSWIENYEKAQKYENIVKNINGI